MKSWLAGIVCIFYCSGAFAQRASNTTSMQAAPDNPGREFLTSCTYGVLAGTLVGAASLAFVAKPGDNLNHVARGASLGLYAGIILGLYVVYIVPGMDDTPEEEPPIARLDRMRFFVSPTFGLRANADGLRADWTMLRF
jgi:hypothetical protein